ncbi:MAG: hypothetical protein AB7O92_04010 [Acidimicrobiia bacterium]
MEVGDLLERMRDPLGAPFYPPVFQVLLVITWVLHIFFVTVALGCSAFAVYGFVRRGEGREHRVRLARHAARATTSATGFGIVTGIAPLLFIQTIYDPIWYASNTLTGFWSVVFVFVVMGGYGFAYLFYLKGSPRERLVWSAVASMVLLFFAGWIMHVLASVSIRPEQWQDWYAPGGIPDTRGITFHAFNVPRLTFLLPLQAGLGLAVVLALYAWYYGRRDDADEPYLAWVASLARRLGLAVSPLYALAGVAWALTEGRSLDVAIPVGVATGGLGVALFGLFFLVKDPARRAPRMLWGWLAALAVVAVTREYIRATVLDRFGYSVSRYPYVVDWGSVLLFAVTTVAGGAVVVYFAMVLFQAGLRADGGPISRRVERLGRISFAMLGAWFAFFLLLGGYAVVVL